MNKINVEKILAKYSSNLNAALSYKGKLSKENLTASEAKAAIKEIVEAVVNKYAIIAEKESPRVYSNEKSYPVVDGRTADKIKNLVNYG